MFSRKSFLVLFAITSCIALLSMSLKKKSTDRSIAVIKIARMYGEEMRRLDSVLQTYPKYFNDSSYAVRTSKFRELVRQLKKTECLFTYFHPKLSYDHFLKTA